MRSFLFRTSATRLLIIGVVCVPVSAMDFTTGQTATGIIFALLAVVMVYRFFQVRRASRAISN